MQTKSIDIKGNAHSGPAKVEFPQKFIIIFDEVSALEYEVMLEKLSERIHREMNRKDRRWKINKLAAESRVDPKIISKLLHNREMNPELKTLDKIATAFGLTLEDFCNSTGKK